jgi:hypothetical protein
MVAADGTSVFEIPLATGANIQTNPDWAPDARPECPDSTVTTPPNIPVTFQVVCNDTGPEYEQTDVLEFNETNPTHGTLAPQDQAGDPFTYIPDSGFVGTDSFQVKSFDALGFGSDTGTVTLRVQTPGAGTQTTTQKKKCKKKKHKRSADSAKKKKCKKKKRK